jgi:hypothetical protein
MDCLATALLAMVTLLSNEPGVADARILYAQGRGQQRPGEIISITGVRLTHGNAVDCPLIQDDDGKNHAVSYLSPNILIGDRVTIRGHHGVTTGCRGTVLIAEQEMQE